MGALAGVAAGVAAGAAAQTVTGIGLVLVGGPVLALLLGAGEAVRVALVTSLALNAVLVARQPRAVRWRPVTRLSAPAVAAAIPLAMLVHGADDRAVAGLAGAAMITAAGVPAGHALATRLPESRTRQLILLLAAAGGVTVAAQALT